MSTHPKDQNFGGVILRVLSQWLLQCHQVKAGVSVLSVETRGYISLTTDEKKLIKLLLQRLKISSQGNILELVLFNISLVLFITSGENT